MRYSLQQLRVFVEICRLGSVSRASEILGLSQSATSTALAELERRSGARLFDRAGKRLHLNELGRSLLPSSIELLDRASELDEKLAGHSGPGPLNVGATMTIGNYLLPGLIERYWTLHPAAPLSVKVNNTRDTVQRVLEFDLDLALIEGHSADPALRITRWLEDELVLFCGPTHPFAQASEVPIARVLGEQWVVREKGSGSRDALDIAMQPWRDDWQIALELEHIEAMLRIVAIGRLIGCASRLALRDDLASGRLVEIHVPGLRIIRDFSIVVHRDKFTTAALHAFLGVCREAASDTRSSHQAAIGYSR